MWVELPFIAVWHIWNYILHYNDVIINTMASQITSLMVVCSTVYSDADQRKHQSSASLAFVWGIHRDRWIPRTNGQLRGKCFHLMTSSWEGVIFWHHTSLCVPMVQPMTVWQQTIKWFSFDAFPISKMLYILHTALTHWGRVTHICVSKLTVIGRRQAIIWTNAWMLLIGPLVKYISEIVIAIQTFSFAKMHLKMSSAKWRPLCFGLNV